MIPKRFKVTFVLVVSALAACVAATPAATTSVATKAPAAETTNPAAEVLRRAIAAENEANRPERDRLVEQALAASPDYAPARWQAGQVRSGDDWVSIDDAVQKGAGDDLLAEYHKLRSQYIKTPEGQITLARWCQKHHLDDEMKAHAAKLLQSGSADPEVLKMLDLSWHKGALVTSAELVERKEREEKARLAMQHWRPIVAAMRTKIEGKSDEEREAGLRELAEIHDPAAIDAILSVLKNRPSSLREAIRVIGEMPGQEATDALVRQALLSKSDDLVLAACERLKSRSPYGYVPKLMAALSTPMTTKLEVERAADGIHFRETVEREREDATVGTSVDTEVGLLVPNPNLNQIIGQTYVETLADTQTAAKSNAKLNRKLTNANDAIYRVLENTVGPVAKREPSAWWDWWHNYNVMSIAKKPRYVDNYYNPVEVSYVPYLPATTMRFLNYLYQLTRPSCDGCFARGTKVWSETGLVPIENVQIGDRVLAQSPLTGELAFKPVLDITVGHQPFIEITTTDKRTLVPTGGHAFWVSGFGWRLARELKVGDRLHTTAGWVEIESLRPLEADETHNLIVADFNTYFVGEDRVLTHDITIPQMVTGGVPGELALGSQ
ncbi:MAG TPA: polymorphic toxin-type HINT domain-containing protein [Pirellulales bacterium]|nr:polymorphic toxin-type HINT domain-containing protein [Pirellulales bacterium]